MEQTMTKIKETAIVEFIQGHLNLGYYYEEGNGGRAEAIRETGRLLRKSEQFDSGQKADGIAAAVGAGILTAEEAETL